MQYQPNTPEQNKEFFSSNYYKTWLEMCKIEWNGYQEVNTQIFNYNKVVNELKKEEKEGKKG